jgi:hypothetical protein
MPITFLNEKRGGVSFMDDGNPAAANETLNKGLLFDATPEEMEAITTNLSPEDLEFETATKYYTQKFGTNLTPEAVTANIQFEYGDDATAATANAANLKAAKWQRLKTFGASILETGKAVAGTLPQVSPMSIGQPYVDPKWKPIPKREWIKAKRDLATSIGEAIPESWDEARDVMRQKASMPLEGSALDKTLQFLDKGGILLADNAGNMIASQINPALGMATMYANEKNSMFDALEAAGVDIEISDDASSMYGMLSAPVEYVEQVGRISSAFGVNPKKTLLRAVGKKLKNAGINIAEESIQKLFDDLVYNQAVTENNEKFGTTIPVRDLTEGYGETAVSSLAMSTVMEALGLSVKGSKTAWTQGDATRTRKQNSNEQIDTIVEEADIPAEQKPLMEEMLKNPTEQSTESFNSWEPEVAETTTDAPVTTPEGEDVTLSGEFNAEQPAGDPKVVSDEKVSPEVAETPLTPQEIETAPIQEISERAQKILDIGEKIKAPFKKMASLTTRVKEIAPKVTIAMNKADQKTHKIITANTKSIVAFAKSVKTVRKNVTKEEWKVIKAEILNGDWTALNARGIEGMAELQQMFQETADALGIKSIENYFRRKVKDYDGLIKHLGEKPKGRFKKALDAKAAEKGRDLTPAEKKVVIREALRTREGSGLGQKRTIDNLTPEMAEFYEDPLTELENYIRTSAQTIARKEMLGIDQGVSDELGEVDPSVTEDDIASIVAEMAEEGISRKDERELSELLKSHLEYKRAPKWVGILRRLVAVKYVTKIKTTVKQWGDFFVTMAENGVVNTFGSAKEAKNWSDTFGREVELSLQEQGVEKLDAELQADKRKLIEEMIFKPLQSQDLLGKRILMRSTAMKWRRLAKSNPAKLRKQLMKKFEHAEFVDGIIADMKNKTLSEDVSFALYSQMADFHPISHSQHIKLYIDHPILRPLFMLKSFAFKRYDRLYREGISQVIDGLASHRAAAIDGDVQGRKDAASELASGILGISRFMIFAVGGEMVIEKMYKEAMQALGFAPEEIPEDESWSSMYIQEAGKIFPFVDPFALENAIERGDPMHYFDKAYDVPGPLGSDAVMDLIKHMRGTKDADVNKWKKDIPWFGELMWGAEQEGRERELKKKRKAQVKSKK